jgi:NitT/TauT family transport system substrate-binding protein
MYETNSVRAPHRRAKALLTGRRSLIAAAAMLVAGALLLSACSSSPSSTDSASNSTGGTVRVSIAPTGTALPVVVADKQGFFKKQGIHVTWQVSNVTISDQLATLGRQFDVAMGTQPALISAANQGISLVNITGGALDTKENPQADIVASASSGIKSIADLGGKQIGSLSLTGNIHYALLYGAKKAGVDVSSINFVVGTVPQLPDQLKAGRVQAIEEIEPFAGFAVANGGVSAGDPFRSIGNEAYLGIMLSDKTWANQNEATIGKFTAALDEAAKWIAGNQDAARTVLGSYSGAKGDVLAKTPIPDFRFQTNGKDLAASQGPDLKTWINILKSTSDFKATVAPADLLPRWAK